MPGFVLANQLFLMFILAHYFLLHAAGLKSWLFGSVLILGVDMVFRLIFIRINYLPYLELIIMGVSKSRLSGYVLFRSLLEWMNLGSFLVILIYYYRWPIELSDISVRILLIHAGMVLLIHYLILWFKSIHSRHHKWKLLWIVLPVLYVVLYDLVISDPRQITMLKQSWLVWYLPLAVFFLLTIITVAFFRYLKFQSLYEK